MSLDRLDALESRIRDLVKELKRRNAALEGELKAARERLAAQNDSNRRWERERVDIKSRVEKVLGELDLLDGYDERKEVAID